MGKQSFSFLTKLMFLSVGTGPGMRIEFMIPGYVFTEDILCCLCNQIDNKKWRLVTHGGNHWKINLLGVS